MIVIYHANCVDGFTAAWVARRKYGDAATYVSAKYGDPPPQTGDDEVLVLDFSYPRTVLEALAQVGPVRAFDHHKTAEEDLRGLSYVKFDMNRSGAGLAWDELHGSERPLLVDYVEDRDLWRWALPHSKEISAMIGSYAFDFEVWTRLSEQLETDFEGCVRVGEALLRSIDSYVERQRARARRVSFEGHDALVVNTTHATSELVRRMADCGAFAVGWFQDERGRFVYSLRSRGDFDVSAIAKKYGGGGHKNAAGFTCDRLIL